MDQIQIVEEAQLPKKAKVVIGVPDAGLVGLISATFLIDNLSMEEVASVESDLFPPIVILHNGYPKSPMRIYGKDDLLVAISEIAIHPNVQRQILRELMEWVKGIGASLSIGLSGAPVPNRMDIDRPKVYGVAVNVDGKIMEKMGVEPLQEAMLAGPYAVLLETCRKENYPNITLLAQSHLQYPDPGASAMALKAAESVIGQTLDVKPLLERAEEIRIKMRDVMRSTQRMMRDAGKEKEYELPSMYV